MVLTKKDYFPMVEADLSMAIMQLNIFYRRAARENGWIT
jgi:hypothetical protein